MGDATYIIFIRFQYNIIYKGNFFNYTKNVSPQFISELAITPPWQKVFPKNYEKAFAYKEIS